MYLTPYDRLMRLFNDELVDEFEAVQDDRYPHSFSFSVDKPHLLGCIFQITYFHQNPPRVVIKAYRECWFTRFKQRLDKRWYNFTWDVDHFLYSARRYLNV